MRTFMCVVLSSLAILLTSADSVPAQDKEKANTDTAFVTKVIPGVTAAASVSEYVAKNSSDEKVRDFAEAVAKQHKEFVKTAVDTAKRLKFAVATGPDKEGQEMIEKLSKLKGDDFNSAYLKWLIDGHEKGMSVFEAEVKNGADADLKAQAKESIKVGMEHIKGASELLGKIKK
jgi:putative membrane protein